METRPRQTKFKSRSGKKKSRKLRQEILVTEREAELLRDKTSGVRWRWTLSSLVVGVLLAVTLRMALALAVFVCAVLSGLLKGVVSCWMPLGSVIAVVVFVLGSICGFWAWLGVRWVELSRDELRLGLVCLGGVGTSHDGFILGSEGPGELLPGSLAVCGNILLLPFSIPIPRIRL